jgi:hypothetical protein
VPECFQIADLKILTVSASASAVSRVADFKYFYPFLFVVLLCQ